MDIVEPTNVCYARAMTELSSNDRAFISVTEELIRRQNDLEALRKLETICGGINDWTRKNLDGLNPKRQHTEKLQGLTRAVHFLGNVGELRKEIKNTEGRIESLKTLAEAYMTGGDIVQIKLSMDND